MVTRFDVAVYAIAAFLVYEYATRNPADTLGQGIVADIGASVKNLTTTQPTTSPAGLTAIRQREGYVATVYNDTQGYATAGIGHKLTPLDNLTNGATISDSQIQSWFSSDIAHAENLVNYNVDTTILTQNEFDALVSMTFNLGGQLWKNSNGSDTGIKTALLNGDVAGASAQIMRWDKPSAIISRRQSEYNQFTA